MKKWLVGLLLVFSSLSDLGASSLSGSLKSCVSALGFLRGGPQVQSHALQRAREDLRIHPRSLDEVLAKSGVYRDPHLLLAWLAEIHPDLASRIEQIANQNQRLSLPFGLKLFASDFWRQGHKTRWRRRLETIAQHLAGPQGWKERLQAFVFPASYHRYRVEKWALLELIETLRREDLNSAGLRTWFEVERDSPQPRASLDHSLYPSSLAIFSLKKAVLALGLSITGILITNRMALAQSLEAENQAQRAILEPGTSDSKTAQDSLRSEIKRLEANLDRLPKPKEPQSPQPAPSQPE